jgi:hypothetical protein
MIRTKTIPTANNPAGFAEALREQIEVSFVFVSDFPHHRDASLRQEFSFC